MTTTQIERRAVPVTGILQEWVAELGLRHQGVLLTAVRGCDTAPKEDASKAFSRAVRGVLLNTHCANPENSRSFIESLTPGRIWVRFEDLKKSGFDSYPHHFVMHLIHACEIIGYCHPDQDMAHTFVRIYQEFCRKLHLQPEGPEALDRRLNADETSFGDSQR